MPLFFKYLYMVSKVFTGVHASKLRNTSYFCWVVKEEDGDDQGYQDQDPSRDQWESSMTTKKFRCDNRLL